MSDVSKDIVSDKGKSKSIWEELNLSSNILGSMPYGNYRISVYEHVANFHLMADSKKKKYFYSPVALLDPESATCYPGGTLGITELRFRIELWNENLEKKIAEFIEELTEQEVKLARVQVIPFEIVHLHQPPDCTYYQVSSDWPPYQQQKSMWFTVTSSHSGDDLLKSLRTKPERFSNLRLLFALPSKIPMPIPVNFSPNLTTKQLIDLPKDKKNVVVFDAYRTSSFDTINAIVTYVGTNVNFGRSMYISKGTFYAPIPGVYSFEFHGHTPGDVKTGTRVYLQLNGETKTTAHTGSNPWMAISCSVILPLQYGDQVSMVLDEGCLYDTPYDIFTHFSGRLLYLY